MAKNYGKVYGRPRIPIGYGMSTAKVKRNIRQKTRTGGFKLSKGKSFGFGK